MWQSSSCTAVCLTACRHPARHWTAQVARGERCTAKIRQPSQEAGRFFIQANKVRGKGISNIDLSAKELSPCSKMPSSRFDLQRAARLVQNEAGEFWPWRAHRGLSISQDMPQPTPHSHSQKNVLKDRHVSCKPCFPAVRSTWTHV